MGIIFFAAFRTLVARHAGEYLPHSVCVAVSWVLDHEGGLMMIGDDEWGPSRGSAGFAQIARLCATRSGMAQPVGVLGKKIFPLCPHFAQTAS
jgi:hypothetical protein